MQGAAFDNQEGRFLAAYAVRSRDSRGRTYPEAEHSFRLPFQRDRDRIVHSSAFRRLEYKTQVFVNHEGDYYRTRLTHTVEAAQIARTLARALAVNEDLVEAIALAHDLGHTPFGHAGERVLNELMAPYGGFEHNMQSLRIVDVLERRYPEFDGLNLTYEVREGIAKHSPPYDRPVAAPFDPGAAPPLEAQLVDFADEIAYTSHDIDDGLQSQMLDPDELEAVPLWRETLAAVRRRHAGVDSSILRYQSLRHLIDRLVTDLVDNVKARISAEGIEAVDEIRRRRRPIVAFSDDLSGQVAQMKAFLFDKLYCHHRVIRMTRKAQGVMRQLFQAYVDEPRQLPAHILRRCESGETLHRVIADYIAGMTDRFAIQEHGKLFSPQERA